jgi:lipopolysaccharide transport system ATP-binding protein
MSDIAIQAEGLSKLYRIRERRRYRMLRDSIAKGFTAPLRRLRQIDRRKTTGNGSPDLQSPVSSPDGYIWALKDVSFEIKHGEVVGVIGRNGAGKSTLLKILSRITEPTEGELRLYGRVGSLLEVGTGFHPELTGRENIYLNGAILGMKKEEISRKFDEIVSFAEVEKFLDTPVRHYSSGMYMRLAFSVAAHLEPEIMVVDEVLAVGDAAFQKKCLGKMGEVAKEGRTVLFVSHNMGAIQKLCTKAVLIAGGKLIAEGETSSVTDSYMLEAISHTDTYFEFPWPEGATGAVTSLRIVPGSDEQRGQLRAGEAWVAEVHFTLKKPVDHCIVACGIMGADGRPIHTFWSRPHDLPTGSHLMTFSYDQVQLSAGIYRIALGLSSYERSIHYLEDAGSIRVDDVPADGVQAIRTSGTGYLLNPVEAKVKICVRSQDTI